MKKYLIIICLALAVLCAWFGQALSRCNKDRERLQNNQNALMQEVRLYETKLGESAASVQRLQLTKDELEGKYKAICQEAEDLGIKLKRLQSVSQTTTQAEIHAKAEIRDSIVYKPEIHLVDTLKAFCWKDPPWAFVDGVIDSGKVDLSISTNDTIIQIVHRVPKKFLCFRFGTKAIRQEVISKNPHNRIRYSEYIELTK
ncbi:MAG: hypothetical protein K6E94_00425 [Elusimicrobiaceae bacterium]|nr:hypothetical protein [Elusimicrobiaceae bacterium]